MSTRTLSLVLALMALSLAGGMHLGGYFERQQQAERERGAVAVVSHAQTVALPTLRCTNGAPPQPWTRVEAESAYHAAKMYQESAEAAGLWNDLGRRAMQTATVRYLEVLICGGGEKP